MKKNSKERLSQVGTGDRSERIRTYNYPQGRVTDHRINYTTHQIEAINDGELDDLIDALTAQDQVKKLENLDTNWGQLAVLFLIVYHRYLKSQVFF